MIKIDNKDFRFETVTQFEYLGVKLADKSEKKTRVNESSELVHQTIQQYFRAKVCLLKKFEQLNQVTNLTQLEHYLFNYILRYLQYICSPVGSLNSLLQS